MFLSYCVESEPLFPAATKLGLPISDFRIALGKHPQIPFWGYRICSVISKSSLEIRSTDWDDAADDARDAQESLSEAGEQLSISGRASYQQNSLKDWVLHKEDEGNKGSYIKPEGRVAAGEHICISKHSPCSWHLCWQPSLSSLWGPLMGVSSLSQGKSWAPYLVMRAQSQLWGWQRILLHEDCYGEICNTSHICFGLKVLCMSARHKLCCFFFNNGFPSLG